MLRIARSYLHRGVSISPEPDFANRTQRERTSVTLGAEVFINRKCVCHHCRSMRRTRFIGGRMIMSRCSARFFSFTLVSAIFGACLAFPLQIAQAQTDKPQRPK